mgnify:CR=1 FL=1
MKISPPFKTLNALTSCPWCGGCFFWNDLWASGDEVRTFREPGGVKAGDAGEQSGLGERLDEAFGGAHRAHGVG